MTTPSEISQMIESAKLRVALDWHEKQITSAGRAVASAFRTLRDDKTNPWQLVAATFEDYCQQRWGLGLRRMQQMAAGEAIRALLSDAAPDLAETVAKLPDRSLRAVAALPPQEAAAVVRRAVEDADGEKPTEKQILKAREETKHVSQVSAPKASAPKPPVAERTQLHTCPHCGGELN